jgi:hypothetical protein
VFISEKHGALVGAPGGDRPDVDRGRPAHPTLGMAAKHLFGPGACGRLSKSDSPHLGRASLAVTVGFAGRAALQACQECSDRAPASPTTT